MAALASSSPQSLSTGSEIRTAPPSPTGYYGNHGDGSQMSSTTQRALMDYSQAPGTDGVVPNGGDWAPYLPRETPKRDAHQLRDQRANGERVRIISDSRRPRSRSYDGSPRWPRNNGEGFHVDAIQYPMYGGALECIMRNGPFAQFWGSKFNNLYMPICPSLSPM